MPFSHTIVPCENQSCLDRLLILAQFPHKSSSLRDTSMESSLKPLIQFFASTISEHLSKLLEQGIEALHLGMDLANQLERHALFFGEIVRTAQHQSHSSTGSQFNGCCRLAHFHPLLFHTAESQEKPFNRHARAGISTIRHFAEEANSMALPFNPTRAQIGFIGSQNAWMTWAFCPFGKRLCANRAND